ncbi:uncharacterized protein LOC116305028 [Actinia tenebrosa]|uniref:Uncharacterized protein LOC116305028 n=1 Tax=Actinia tenebrosa TaxID=6105 RepID=A0A6P8IUU8_ACTTE|nr:uncharacterized protein LOC116305028 [Actinia tenebrosa]XP_031570713.1 uncharacterized protein LOC116305028 [Actinia tenebrosa]
MNGATAVVLVLFCVISQSLAQTPAKAKNSTKPTPKPTVPPGQLKCRVFNITIKLTNTSFSEDFQNVHSKDFTNTRIELEAGIHQAFDGYKPFQALKVHQFTKSADGKVLAHFYLEFKGNGTHLKNLIAALAKGKLGVLTVQPTLVKAGCFVNTPVPMVCSYPCPTVCAPSCSSLCCGQYQPPPVMLPPPPPPPPPPQCPGPCSPACAPTCSPACCQTAYYSPYGKRHHAPKPNKEDVQKLRKHLLKKHAKKH